MTTREILAKRGHARRDRLTLVLALGAVIVSFVALASVGLLSLHVRRAITVDDLARALRAIEEPPTIIVPNSLSPRCRHRSEACA